MTDESRYCFVLGSNPLLSTLEIDNLLSDCTVIEDSIEIRYLKGTGIDQSTIDRLGGTIKIIKVSGEIEIEQFHNQALIDEVVKIIQSLNIEKQSKLHFGISIYNNGGHGSLAHQLSQSLRSNYVNLKKICRERGINLAFVNSTERCLSSASVIKNKLCQSGGIEISVIVRKNEILLGQTIAVQDIDKYSHYDVGRPVRDLISGTTPPKLAKIMINIATQNRDATIIDPFCGSGTFIQEMSLLGHKTIYGSDISPKAIDDTRLNISWLKSQTDLHDVNIDVFIADVRRLSEIFNPGTIDAVVGEGYLGPALTEMMSEHKLNHVITELSRFYDQALTEIVKILSPSGRIVIALPVFKTRKNNQYLPIDQTLQTLGLTNMLDRKKINEVYKQFLSPRNSVVYSRPDQLVLREILVLDKQ